MALDRHLADQMLLPLSCAEGPSEFTTVEVTKHLETNAWVIEQFKTAEIDIQREPNGNGHITVRPCR